MRVSYKPILPEHVPWLSSFLQGSFFREEPLVKALALPPEQVSRWLPGFLEAIIKDGVSIMAVDDTTNEFVGASVNMIFRPTKENVLMSDYADPVLEPVMYKILKLLGGLNEGIIRPNRPDRILRILFLSVISSYGGKGIAMELIKKSEEHAQSLGLSSIQVDTTSEFSYKAYTKSGYACLREWEYSEYEDNGEKILANKNMGVHHRARILYKML